MGPATKGQSRARLTLDARLRQDCGIAVDRIVYPRNRQPTIMDVNMKISTAESVVMGALWAREPLTAEEITGEVAEGQGWSEATVKTLINRLLNKGAIGAERDGRKYLYHPLMAREAYLEAESQGLLDRLFDGRLGPLVSHFSETRKLTAEDIAELKKLIEDFEP
jgi:predicted transcriptional regulator